jgi:hypothetical protein
MEHGWMKPKGPLDEDEKRRLVLKLVTQLRCMECGNPYDVHDFALVDRQPDVWVLDIRCRHCDSSSHVVILMHLAAQSGPAVHLTPEEIQMAEESPPISRDDVLDVHELLQEFDGDLDDLFC